jgi:hypothetical protein
VIRRALGVLLAIVIALAGVIALLLVLQSRDHGSLERPATTQTRTSTTP